MKTRDRAKQTLNILLAVCEQLDIDPFEARMKGDMIRKRILANAAEEKYNLMYAEDEDEILKSIRQTRANQKPWLEDTKPGLSLIDIIDPPGDEDGES